MAIKYHENSKTFHLYNESISYIFKVLENNQLGQLYFGNKIKDRDNFDHLLEMQSRTMSVCIYENNPYFSLEHIKQEYPTYGSGDMRYPAIDISQKNGGKVLNFEFVSFKIFKGKKTLNGLPATYVENADEADSLEITLYDKLIETKLKLLYTIYNELPVITRSVNIENCGSDDIKLNRIMSLNLDLPDMDYEMLELTGAWARERHIKTRKLEQGIQSIYSMRGCSSANFNPFIALKREGCTEYKGEIIGFSLIYSGNFLAQVDVDTYDTSRVSLGINPHGFEWILKSDESFQTPEAVIVYSGKGINDMSQTFHSLYQKRLARGKYRDEVRPILVNNWEATYFDFDEEKLISFAEKSKSLGAELFVLDDGWFGNRNNSKSGLGDWHPNLEKIPSGIDGLSKKINKLGIKFGLWIEPEMVNKDSELYRNHPEWILQTPNRNLSQGRNQYVLDFSNNEVVDYIYDTLKNLLEKSEVSYIKWDMNRSMSEVYSLAHKSEDQGKIMHKYILGLYDLYERLINDFPNILFESCASGGSRFDPGMLYYAPQAWTSDNTDAIERLKIQYGSSIVYPISSMGSHVSAAPNEQMYRNTPLDTRANVAYFGTFGYELDVTNLSEDEEKIIIEQIKFMKKYRDIFQFGKFYRLSSPFSSNETSWMVVSEDKKLAIVGYYRVLQKVNQSFRRVKLLGLDPNLEYVISTYDYKVYGDELMNVGLITSDYSSGKYRGVGKIEGDYLSRLYVLKSIS
ncbi:alpha-galactosidase [uncultured Anaerococcus sp.]|uniref:alpha-galactosidase n=1 Tax=uncultured Anaerococcus sp. TaxID=293428 RepID=UPI0025D2A03E|nr:alpha-galactosidase [uncultured Anaerococcus sp.]